MTNETDSFDKLIRTLILQINVFKARHIDMLYTFLKFSSMLSLNYKREVI